jgi:hypothetical protein
MGCDIHCFVEKRNTNGDWEQIKGFVSDMYKVESEYFSSDHYKMADSPFGKRNYTTFSVLAGVRDDIGNTPISSPRGLPSDVSDEADGEAKSWGDDGHSHSWLTAKEIREFRDMGGKLKFKGYMTAEKYKEFKETGNPFPYSDDVFGENILKASNEACEEVQRLVPDKIVYTLVEWKQDAKERTGTLLGDGLRQLMERSDTGDGDDVRIVFWFDN